MAVPLVVPTSKATSNRKRRLLLDPTETAPDIRQKRAKRPLLDEHCAKLVTEDSRGRRQDVYVALDRPVTIGRHKTCTYVLPDLVVSNYHFKVYAIRSSTGGIILSCQDKSTNGTMWNTHLIKRAPIVLSDGDVLQIPKSKSFKVVFSSSPSENVAQRHPKVPLQKLDRYLLTEHSLGSGTFGTVRVAVDDLMHRQVACKTVFTGNEGKPAAIQAKRALVMKEVRILESLRHPNINSVLDVFSEKTHIHILLELCTGGDLLQFIELRVQLNESESKYLGYQLMKGLEYIHARDISHRDIKPENILLYAPGSYPRIQLADFGYARNQSRETTRSICGTISYVPPEALLTIFSRGKQPRGKNGGLSKSPSGYSGLHFDCWSLGVCLYFMLSGGHPFDHGFGYSQDQAQEDTQHQTKLDPQLSTNSEHIIKDRIATGLIEFHWRGWTLLRSAQSLISGLLEQDPKYRTTIGGALNSPWVADDHAELKKLYAKRILGSN